jgi:hypothetical protein
MVTVGMTTAFKRLTPEAEPFFEFKRLSSQPEASKAANFVEYGSCQLERWLAILPARVLWYKILL